MRSARGCRVPRLRCCGAVEPGLWSPCARRPKSPGRRGRTRRHVWVGVHRSGCRSVAESGGAALGPSACARGSVPAGRRGGGRCAARRGPRPAPAGSRRRPCGTGQRDQPFDPRRAGPVQEVVRTWSIVDPPVGHRVVQVAMTPPVLRHQRQIPTSVRTGLSVHSTASANSNGPPAESGIGRTHGETRTTAPAPSESSSGDCGMPAGLPWLRCFAVMPNRVMLNRTVIEDCIPSRFRGVGA
ncbi:hypothetical protein EV192_106687 [Actinocrispum wychmicini]|uniref:Uncharacterized protein n=1 Tax=Actinocrispum wychmicini TaxID=1213861 RepID=A0A4V2S6S6_9PSEU|nr:hypothetical protein EV192_106687 [Actinocrispum wychmicini]